jgi:hypothetical protein
MLYWAAAQPRAGTAATEEWDEFVNGTGSRRTYPSRPPEQPEAVIRQIENRSVLLFQEDGNSVRSAAWLQAPRIAVEVFSEGLSAEDFEQIIRTMDAGPWGAG